MRNAVGTDFTPGQAEHLRAWIEEKRHRERVRWEAWKITDCRAVKQEPEMSWQEKLFWALDRPLHGVAYVIFVAALLLMAWWVVQLARIGGW